MSDENNTLPLLCTSIYRTIEPMHANVRKIVDRLQEIERQRFDLGREAYGLKRALEVMGIRPTKTNTKIQPREELYAINRPFARQGLRETCLTVLRDCKDMWLTKSNVEYLAVRGGYKFEAKDPKNSVDVTLRRIAEEGLCEAQRVRGSKGNQYRYASDQQAEKATDSR